MNFFFASLRLCVNISLRLAAVLILCAAILAQVPAPTDTLGFTPGDDRKLASWASVVDYFKKLDAASDRVMFEEIGKTTMGAPFVYATISSPENLKNLERYKQINAKLADPRTFKSNDVTAKKLIAQGKTIVLITCGIHSTEVGSTLSSMLIAHRLASSNEPEIKKILDNTIILLVPSLNPDGVDIVKNWYDKTLGTKFEGTDPPELYHKYVGHDNNRDWYAFTQVETQLTVDKIHNVWHPQIVHDIHQQGENGSRLFLPPYMQPVEPNVPKQIVEGYTELGNYMAADLRKKGFQGITTNSTYDAWTPARAYSHYHGGVRILSETASAKLATPVTIKYEDLRPGLGYDSKVESPNFGPVWKGGEWKLRNITDYMTTAAFSLLNHAADNREKWLSRFYEIGNEAVRPKRDGELFAYAVRPDFDRISPFLRSLYSAGVEVNYVKSFEADGKSFPSWTQIIRMDQPYAGFARALAEPQKYPELRDNSGNPIPPYDVTAHALALLDKTEVEPIFHLFDQPDWPPGFPHPQGHYTLANNRAADTFLYRSSTPSMDEGWTRWIFKEYNFLINTSQKEFKYQSVTDKEIRTKPRGRTIIFPDQSPNQILNGYAKGTMPDEYVGGVGKEGVENLRKFVENGGTLVFLNRASNFAIEQFKLPVKDVTRGLNRKDFFIPGSILRTELDTTHPIAKGMPQQSIAWFENGPVFEVLSPGFSRQAAGEEPPEGGTQNRSESLLQQASAGEPPEGGTQNRSESLLQQASAGEPPEGGTQNRSESLLQQASAGEPPEGGTQNGPPEGGTQNVRIIARYPTDTKQILLSGWALGAEKIAGKAALIEFTIGKGKIILFGFRPQYRGQSLATFPLLFNAISKE